MNKHFLMLWGGLVIAVSLLGAAFFISPVQAEEVSDELTTIEAEAEELGVAVPGNFFFLKKIGYSLQRAFTFNPVKDAEIDLKQASQELIRARVVATNQNAEQAQVQVENALQKYETKLNKIQTRAEEFKNEIPALAEKFADKLSNVQLKQQEVLSKLEEKLPEEIMVRITEIKNNSLENYVRTVEKIVTNKEEMANRIIEIIDKQDDVDFNRLKHLEVLKSLENKVPTEAKVAIIQAQENVMNKFQMEIKNMADDEKNIQLEQYIIKGNQNQERIKILEDLESDKILSAPLGEQLRVVKNLQIIKQEIKEQGMESPTIEQKQKLEGAQKQVRQYLQLAEEKMIRAKDQTEKQKPYTTNEQQSNVIEGQKKDEAQEPTMGQTGKEIENRSIDRPVQQMTREKAKEQAIQSTCAQQARLTGEGYYNENSRTWWFNLDLDKTGCNPACVVKEDGKVELNWRCTGAIPETPDTENTPPLNCPEWINCMPSPDAPNRNCNIPTGCEEYTQIAY